MFGFCLVSNIQYNTSIYLLTSIKRNFENICKVLLTKLDHFQTSPSLRCSHGSGGPTQTGGGGGGGSNLQSILSLSPPPTLRQGTLWLTVCLANIYRQISTNNLHVRQRTRVAGGGGSKENISERVIPPLPPLLTVMVACLGDLNYSSRYRLSLSLPHII